MKNKFGIYLMIIGIIVLFSLNFISSFDWSSGLIDYYNFENISSSQAVLVDNAYNNINCTLKNMESADWVAGKIGNALSFDGVDEKANCNITAADDLLHIDGNLSISLWVKMGIEADITGPLDMSNTSATSQNYGLLINGANKFFFQWTNGNGTWRSVTQDGFYDTNNWMNIIVTYKNRNVSVYRNGVMNKTTSGNQALSTNVGDYLSIANLKAAATPGGEYLNATIDEIGIWNRSLTDSEVVELYNGGLGLPYANNLYVSLNSPGNNAFMAAVPVIFNATLFPIPAYDLTNATLKIWYSNGTLFNQTTNILTGIATISTTFTFTDFSIGDFVWNVYGCQNNSYCAFALTNHSLRYDGVVNSVTYNASSVETASENFVLNLSIPTGTTLSNPYLVYNGTKYSASIASGTYHLLSKTIDIPSTIGNMSFYFNWSLDGISFNSSNYYQNISIINFSICDATLTTPFLNLTFKDEVSGSYINATLDSSTFNYWAGSGSIYKTYTFLNTTANYNYQFCASPNVTFHNNYTVQYASTGYSQRRQFSTADLTNVTTTKILYLLSSGDGIYSVYQVQDQNGNSITGVSVTAERQISGVWYTLESGSTDSGGAVTFWLNPNFDHRLTFTKSGYTTTTVTVRPSSSTYSVVMTTGAGGGGFNSTLASGVSWKFGVSPFTNVLSQNTTYTFWFWVNSTSANLIAYKQELLDNNSNVISTAIGAVSTGGYANLTINVFQNKSIRGKYSIDTGDGYIVVDADSFWPVSGMSIPVRGTIKAFLSYLNRVNVFGEDEGRKEYSMALLFFIILFIVLGAICYNTGWDFATTGGALMLLVPVVLMASLAGFFNITYLPPGTSELATAQFLQRYSVAIITTLLGGAYMFNKLAEGRGG